MSAPSRTSRTVRLDLAGTPIHIEFRRHGGARFYRLTFRRDGTFRCTVPRRGTLAEAEDFVARQHAWIIERIQARAARPGPPREWRLGTPVWFRGEPAPLVHAPDGPFLGLGPLRFPQPPADTGDFRPWIERQLRRIAARELPARARELAALHGFEPARIQVRNQRSRWGSCSARRVVSLNWRLIQLPPAIADYIVLHEFAHLRHLNHSRRFWDEVARLCPAWEEAERWLKTHGDLLL